MQKRQEFVPQETNLNLLAVKGSDTISERDPLGYQNVKPEDEAKEEDFN